VDALWASIGGCLTLGVGTGSIAGKESRLVFLEGAVRVIRPLVLLSHVGLRRRRAQVGIGTWFALALAVRLE